MKNRIRARIIKDLKKIKSQLRIKSPFHYGLWYIGYLFLYVISFLLSLLPFSILYALALVIFFLVYKIFRYRYNVVLQNLSRSLPGMSYAEIEMIAGKFYRHFSELFAEIVKLTSISRKRLATRVKLVNPELLEHYHQQNRPIIGVLGHYGNWEYLNILPVYLSFPVHAVYKPLSNRAVNLFIKQVRGRFGLHLLPMNQVGLHMLRNKDKSELYLFIADQSPAAEAKCKIDFMHQSTLMFSGAEKLARAINAVVVYFDLERREGKTWRIKCSLLTDSPALAAPLEITRAFAAHLQESICHAPQYWLWTHRRWKY